MTRHDAGLLELYRGQTIHALQGRHQQVNVECAKLDHEERTMAAQDENDHRALRDRHESESKVLLDTHKAQYSAMIEGQKRERLDMIATHERNRADLHRRKQHAHAKADSLKMYLAYQYGSRDTAITSHGLRLGAAAPFSPMYAAITSGATASRHPGRAITSGDPGRADSQRMAAALLPPAAAAAHGEKPAPHAARHVGGSPGGVIEVLDDDETAASTAAAGPSFLDGRVPAFATDEGTSTYPSSSYWFVALSMLSVLRLANSMSVDVSTAGVRGPKGGTPPRIAQTEARSTLAVSQTPTQPQMQTLAVSQTSTQPQLQAQAAVTMDRSATQTGAPERSAVARLHIATSSIRASTSVLSPNNAEKADVCHPPRSCHLALLIRAYVRRRLDSGRALNARIATL